MQNKIIILIGPKGSGKTRKTSELIDGWERVVIFDSIREQAYTGKEIIVGSPQQLYKALPRDREKFRITYRPVVIDIKENGLIDCAEFEPVVKLCYLRGDILLVIDEAHLLANGRNCPKMLTISSLIGRHRKLSMILIAQSFSGISPAVRRNADEFYFWKIIEPSDLSAISERCGRDVEKKVGELRATEIDPETEKFKRAGQMLHWTKFGGVVEVTE